MKQFLAKHNILRTLLAIVIGIIIWILIFGITFFVVHLSHRAQGQYTYDIKFLGITLFNVNNGTYRLNAGSYVILAIIVILCVLIMHFLGKHWSKKYDLDDHDNKHRAKKQGAKEAKKQYKKYHNNKSNAVESSNSNDVDYQNESSQNTTENR